MICKHFVDNILKLARTQGFFCTQLNGFKYCYVSLTIQHQSLHDQTVLFLTIQFIPNHFLAHF